MVVTSKQKIEDSRQHDGRRYVRYRFDFDNHEPVETRPKLVPSDFDDVTDRDKALARVEAGFAQEEVNEAVGAAEQGRNPDRVPVHQTQADFDRRLLGVMMTVRDVDTFHASLPFFKAVETRGGANANQRASYLGIDRTTYDLIADRYGDVEGVAFFVEDEKTQVWDEVPEGMR